MLMTRLACMCSPQRARLATGRIQVRLSEGCPTPLISFGACAHADALPRALLGALQAAGFKEPSPIQASSWAAALRGHDLVGLSRTGR